MTAVGRATPLLSKKRFLIIVVLALILIWQLVVHGAAGQVFMINVLAVDVLQMCQKGKMIPQNKVAETSTSQAAWLLAAGSHCREDGEAASAGWQRALLLSDERLPALRSIAPHDSELAQYAVTLYPARGEAYFWLGDAYLEEKQNQLAANAFAQGLTLDPSDGLVWRKLGDLYRDAGDWEAAVAAFDQACFRIDRGKNGCPRAAGIYMQQGQYELAAQRYRQSISQLPNWQPAQKGLAAALIALDQPDEAIPYLQNLAAKGDTEAAQLLDQINNNNN